MEQVTVTVKQGDKILASGVTAFITIHSHPHGWRSWDGHFGTAVPVAVGVTYTIEATDGRKGTIIVDRATFGTGGSGSGFVGSGPFSK